MAILIFGDAHGDLEAVKSVVRSARQIVPNVAIWSCGDLIDRGPDSKGLIEFCLKEGISAVMGNHESMVVRYLRGVALWDIFPDKFVGGAATAKSYGVSSPHNYGCIDRELKNLIPKPHRDFLFGLPLTAVFEVAGVTYRLSHAGIQKVPGRDTEEVMLETFPDISAGYLSTLIFEAFELPQLEHHILWEWSGPEVMYKFPDNSIQVFGHSPWEGGEAEISAEKGYIALDTGCSTCEPFKLSAVLLHDNGDREIITS